ncbi:MAG: DUF3108 domain-containing protein [Bacteroidota bacterium]|nr:DUF3108 domain-containing protein [Bacteroidota bacterium]
MNFTNKIFLLISIFILIGENVFGQGKILQEGEELNYVVYYGFIKLGEVNMKIVNKKIENNKIIYSSRSLMKSYKGVPFVDLNSIFESEMVYDGKEFYSRRFKAVEYKENATVTIEYNFNYDSNYVYVVKDNNGKIERDEKIKFNSNVKFQDGLSLFYLARLNSYSAEKFLIPVFMNEVETSVNYYFSSKPEDVSVSFLDNDVNCIRCNGVVNFEGIFGLTGEFIGWFSNDEARVPFKSQLNVVIGSINLELVSYKREGWKIKQ